MISLMAEAIERRFFAIESPDLPAGLFFTEVAAASVAPALGAAPALGPAPALGAARPAFLRLPVNALLMFLGGILMV